MTKTIVAVVSVLAGLAGVSFGGPAPGDVFREYMTGDLSRAVAAQLVWSSWSPGYMRGISINGTKVFETEGPKYQYHFHRVPIDQMAAFKPGVNTLTTGKTPLIDGQMVHGMEVNWPGIMVLIQYAGEIPFKRATIDDSVKDPWAKIIADVDGDGRPDVVLSPSELAGNWYRLSWFAAPGDPRQGSWTEHIIADPVECVIHGLAAADFNGDGAVDVAMSEMHQGKDPDEVAVFIDHKGGTAWDKQVLSTKGSHYIRAGDIGSDGDVDLIGTNWSGPYQPVELWENTSAARGASR